MRTARAGATDFPPNMTSCARRAVVRPVSCAKSCFAEVGQPRSHAFTSAHKGFVQSERPDSFTCAHPTTQLPRSSAPSPLRKNASPMLFPQPARTENPSLRSMTATRSAAFGLSLSLLIAAGIATATPASAQTLNPASPVAALTEASEDAQTLDDISAQARTALDAANAALTAAAAVAGDIAASELELDDTSIDTTALRDYIEKFDGLEVMPLLILPGLTADTVAETELVQARADELSGELADAEAKKAAEEAAAAAKKTAEEAAAKAAAEQQAAEEAAAEAEAAAAEESAEQATGTGAAVASTGSNSAGDAQAYAQELGASQYGWGADQFSCLVSLWNRESGWNYQAYNASSGAFGIPQSLPGSKMASAGADWQTNAATQVAWGLGYISAAYGTPCGAWSHSESVGWY